MTFMEIFLRRELLRKTYWQNQSTMAPMHQLVLATLLYISAANIRLGKIRQYHLKIKIDRYQCVPEKNTNKTLM